VADDTDPKPAGGSTSRPDRSTPVRVVDSGRASVVDPGQRTAVDLGRKIALDTSA
jgi:hypothetical protein